MINMIKNVADNPVVLNLLHAFCHLTNSLYSLVTKRLTIYISYVYSLVFVFHIIALYGADLTYVSLLIIFCIIVCVTNKKILNLDLESPEDTFNKT